jgi:hypothetical protein
VVHPKGSDSCDNRSLYHIGGVVLPAMVSFKYRSVNILPDKRMESQQSQEL